jgi:hypothetical protein
MKRLGEGLRRAERRDDAKENDSQNYFLDCHFSHAILLSFNRCDQR